MFWKLLPSNRITSKKKELNWKNVYNSSGNWRQMEKSCRKVSTLHQLQLSRKWHRAKLGMDLKNHPMLQLFYRISNNLVFEYNIYLLLYHYIFLKTKTLCWSFFEITITIFWILSKATHYIISHKYFKYL